MVRPAHHRSGQSLLATANQHVPAHPRIGRDTAPIKNFPHYVTRTIGPLVWRQASCLPWSRASRPVEKNVVSPGVPDWPINFSRPPLFPGSRMPPSTAGETPAATHQGLCRSGQCQDAPRASAHTIHFLSLGQKSRKDGRTRTKSHHLNRERREISNRSRRLGRHGL
jgi:hypothetical protein